MDTQQKNAYWLVYSFERGLKVTSAQFQDDVANDARLATISDLVPQHIAAIIAGEDSVFADIVSELFDDLDVDTAGHTAKYAAAYKELFSLFSDEKRCAELGLDKPLTQNELFEIEQMIIEAANSAKAHGENVEIPAGPPEDRLFLPADFNV